MQISGPANLPFARAARATDPAAVTGLLDQVANDDDHLVWSHQPEELIPEDQRPFAVNGCFYASPTGELLSAYQGRLARLDPNTGKVTSSLSTQRAGLWFSNAWQTLSPDGQTFVLADDHEIRAVSSATGRRLWTHPNRAGDQDMFGRAAPSVGSDGSVYFGTVHGRVKALDNRGKSNWSVDTNLDGRAAPALGQDGRLYVGFLGSASPQPILVLDAATGKELARFPLKHALRSEPFVGADGTLFLQTDKHDVWALDPATGEQRWAYDAPRRRDQALGPTPGPDGLYVSTRRGTLACLDPADGQVRWQFDSDQEIISAPQVGPHGELYVMNSDGDVLALARDKAAWLAAAAASTSVGGATGAALGVLGNRFVVGGVALRLRSQ